MKVVVLANEQQRAELAPTTAEGIVWITHEQAFMEHSPADAFIDLLYVNTAERKALLLQLAPGIVLINSVTETLQETDPSFVRFNGWAGFLSSPIVEAAAMNDDAKASAEAAFSLLGKKVEWLPDSPGFITAGVISMIINEAYLALAGEVSTKEEIDTAMKLGTAYPYGPFEWAEKIGVNNIITLLGKKSKTQPRYQPAHFLLQEAGSVT